MAGLLHTPPRRMLVSTGWLSRGLGGRNQVKLSTAALPAAFFAGFLGLIRLILAQSKECLFEKCPISVRRGKGTRDFYIQLKPLRARIQIVQNLGTGGL